MDHQFFDFILRSNFSRDISDVTDLRKTQHYILKIMMPATMKKTATTLRNSYFSLRMITDKKKTIMKFSDVSAVYNFRGISIIANTAHIVTIKKRKYPEMVWTFKYGEILEFVCLAPFFNRICANPVQIIPKKTKKYDMSVIKHPHSDRFFWITE